MERMLAILAGQAIYEAHHKTHSPKGWQETGIVRLADFLIDQGLKRKASDIHLEPQPDSLRLRYRCDGLLQEAGQLPLEVTAPLISRFKVMAGMDIAQQQKPQDGHIHYDEGLDLRVSSLPAVCGEVLVLRIMDKGGERLTLDELGFLPENLAMLRRLIHQPAGMVVLCGPVNSGKTSTLYAALGELNETTRNLVTFEDPVERLLPGINQVQIHEKAGLTFLAGLKAALRQDVTGILLGEIRDEETAAMAVRIALTGHLLMTTLHTEDTVAAIYRFLEMGVPPYLLAATLSGVIAQRLVRRLCTHCGGKGCTHCGMSGYAGRTVVEEVLLIDDVLRAGILKRWPRERMQELAIQHGLVTLWQNGRQKALKGVTTLEEVRRVLYGEDIADGGTI